MNVNVSNSRVVNVTVINNYYSTTNVQQRNVILVNNVHYENVTVKGAATGVPANAFASGRPVAQAAVVIPPGAMGRASFTATAAVAPTKEAVLGGHTPSAAAPVRLVVPKQIVAKTAPPAPKVSFEQQRPLLEKSGGVPLTAAAHAELRASSPAPKSGRPAVAVVSAKAAAAPAKPAPARPGPAPAAATGKPGVPPTPAVKPVAPAGKPAAAAETGKPAALPTPAGKPANAPMVVGGKQVTPPTTAVKPGVPPPAKKTPTPPPKKKDEKEKEGK
jgi:hypothetical protein